MKKISVKSVFMLKDFTASYFNYKVQHIVFRLSAPALDWAEHLTLPTRFSVETSGAIESGILTKKARVEIHNSIATLMLVYTSRPTSNDRDVVCRRLIQKYPTLKDSSLNGYVSSHPRYSCTQLFTHITLRTAVYMYFSILCLL